jgi:hypothetical protein
VIGNQKARKQVKHQRWSKPQNATHIKLSQGNGLGLFEFGQQQSCYQESAQDEEEINAEEATREGKRGKPMMDNYGDDRNPTQSIKLGNMPRYESLHAGAARSNADRVSVAKS